MNKVSKVSCLTGVEAPPATGDGADSERETARERETGKDKGGDSGRQVGRER